MDTRNKDCESRVEKKSLRKKTEKQYYAEAIKYGYTLVIHMWPKDLPDADKDYEAEEKRK
jgi:hypothetical protein